MSRHRLTFAVALTLSAAYQFYALWSDGVMRSKPTAVRRVGAEHVAPLPQSLLAVAQQYLPQADWVRNSEFTFERQNELFIFAGRVGPDRAESPGPDAGRQVRLEPFALVRMDVHRPLAQPLVICCDSARLQFANPVKLSLEGGSPGRLTAAWFEGQVDITGPDGLHLQGQDFSFAEISRSLHTANRVAFAFGPTQENSARVRGAADELFVDLGPNTKPMPDPAMPRIGAVQRIRLLRQVVLDCEYEQEHHRQPPGQAVVHISCDESLEFDALKREATLLQNVYLRQPTGGEQRPDEADTLRCHQLALRFVEREELPTAKQADNADRAAMPSATGHNPVAGLHVEQVVASGSERGSRVVLRSDSRQITAEAEQLQYDMIARKAVLSDQHAAVEVNRSGMLLRSQVIHIVPDDSTQSYVVTCLRRGLLQQPDPDGGRPLLEATWDERLHAAPDPATGLLLVQLGRNVNLTMQERGGLSADQMNVWIDDTGLQQADAGRPAPASRPGEKLAAVERPPVRYVEARGGVVMASEGMRVETELLQATIESGKLPEKGGDVPRLAADQSSSRPLTAEDERASSSGPGRQADSSRSRPGVGWRLNSQSASLRLLNAPQSRDVQIAEAHADGNVVITRTFAAGFTPRAGEQAFTLSGTHVDLVNAGDVDQVVTVTGAPALLRRGDLLLECRNLQLDRAGNLATVDDEGSLQAPVNRDQDGADLAEPMTLDVSWKAGMTFDGECAAFRKQVKLQLRDRILQCAEMDVRLNEPIRFTDERADSAELAIRDIDCRTDVQVEIYDWQENRLIGVRTVRLPQLSLDYQSGAFHGNGPGRIHHWSQRDRRRIAIAHRETAQANLPSAPDALGWEYVSVDFDDLLRGNLKNQTAELHGRVRSIYAPVERVSKSFVRDELSGTSPSAEHAVWLGCDVMNIELRPTVPTTPAGEKPSEQLLIVTADGRCELEGQTFHARADSLSFEEEKSLFTLRGTGDHEARILFQEAPGAEPRSFPGKVIQFIPSDGGKVRLARSSGVQGPQ